MENYLKKFIEDHIALIEKSEWEELYEIANDYWTDEEDTGFLRTGKLTVALEEAGIYPLEQLSFIPKYYYEGVELDKVVIPSGIEKIKENAFVEGYIKQLILPSTLTNIDEDAFSGTQIKEIIYRGTIADWQKVNCKDCWLWLADKPKFIKATDGSIKI